MRRAAVPFVVFASLLFLVRPSGGEPARAALSVTLVDLRSDGGQIGCLLFDGPGGFPTEPNAAVQKRWSPIAGKTATCRFDQIPAGDYAVACFHDENKNGKLDKNLFGFPREGTTVSNHARGSMGPPKFEQARFRFAGTPLELKLPVDY